MSDVTEVTPEVYFLNSGLGPNMGCRPVSSRILNEYDYYYTISYVGEPEATLKWHILSLKVENCNDLQIKTIRMNSLKWHSGEYIILSKNF